MIVNIFEKGLSQIEFSFWKNTFFIVREIGNFKQGIPIKLHIKDQPGR